MVKFCEYCATKIEENEAKCKNCGATIEIDSNFVQKNDEKIGSANYDAQEESNVQNNDTKKISGMAIASLVCSIVGLFVSGIILGIISICCSITFQKRMKVYKDEKGKGLAMAGIILGGIDIIGAIIVLNTYYKVF